MGNGPSSDPLFRHRDDRRVDQVTVIEPPNGELAREVAAATAADVADIAGDYPVGACPRAAYDHHAQV
jgi:hypothetical protein